MPDEPLVLREAAAKTGFSATHLRTLARSGEIEAWKVGRDWVTTEAAVRAYLATRRKRARGPYSAQDRA